MDKRKAGGSILLVHYMDEMNGNAQQTTVEQQGNKQLQLVTMREEGLHSNKSKHS
jgi:hypothetical protein